MDIETHIEDSKNWDSIVRESGYTVNAVCSHFEINKARFMSWVILDVKPNKKSMEKLKIALRKFLECNIPEYSMSYGYATEHEVSILKSPMLTPDKNDAIERIESRKNNGRKLDFIERNERKISSDPRQIEMPLMVSP